MNEQYLNAQEVAEWIGVSPDTILDMHQQGRIPSVPIPGTRLVRFDPMKIRAWLDQGQPETVQSEPPLVADAHHCSACCPVEREDTQRFYAALIRRNRLTHSGGTASV